RPVSLDLPGNEFVQFGAAPVRRGHQVLGRSERMEPAPEPREEVGKRIRITAGLSRYALDDGKQVLGAMADLSQQRLEGLFTTLLLRRFDLGRHHAQKGAVLIQVRIDPDLEPTHAVRAGYADFETLRIRRRSHLVPCRVDTF